MKEDQTTALKFLETHLEPKLHKVSHGGVNLDVLLYPSGLTAKAVTEFTDKLLEKPRRKTGTITATSHESFNEIVKAHKEGSSAIFVNGDTGAFTAVLNFHDKAADGQRFGDLRVSYTPKKSKVWETWNAKSAQNMIVPDFADFIDEHILDITEPPPVDSDNEADLRLRDLAKSFSTTIAPKAKLIEVSRGLRIHSNDEMETVVNTNSGETAIQFKNEHKDATGNRLEVPGLFCIAVPVFDRGVVYRLPVRFKYRAKGAVVFSYTLLNGDKAIENAIAEMVTTTRAATELPVFYGSPPSA